MTVMPPGNFSVGFAFIWAVCLVLLVIWPRRLPAGTEGMIIWVGAFACRLLLLPFDPPNLEISDGSVTSPVLSIAAHYGKMATPAFDLGALALILVLLRRRNQLLRWAVLYAFNPLIFYGLGEQGYPEAMQNFFLLGALVCYDRQSWRLMFFCLAAVIWVNMVMIVTLPFFFRRDNWSDAWMGLATLGGIGLMIADSGNGAVVHGLIPFLHKATYTGPICEYFIFLGASSHDAAILCGVLLLVLFCGAYLVLHPRRNQRFQDDPVCGCFFVIGATLLMSPVFHLRYLCWVIPFLVLQPVMSWLFLCLSLSVSFVIYDGSCGTGVRNIPFGIQLAAWVPFWMFLARDFFLAFKRMKAPLGTTPRTVTVIIPAWNEEDRIIACIKAVQNNSQVAEIIVVDGGSLDNTRQVAEQCGARVIQHPVPPEKGGGRGGQILAGLRMARGDVVAVVHADAILPAEIMTNLLAVLSKHPQVVGGAIGCVFDGQGVGMRLLEFANDFRAGCFGLSFGDQVQFFRRQPVLQCGVFPALPLMEDVELSLRLSRLGRQVFLFGDVLVSARRWRKDGFGNVLTVIRLLGLYLWQRLWGKTDPLALYRRYYGP